MVLTHEITHMFGLKHCSDWQCRMEVAGGRTGDILGDLDEVRPCCIIDIALSVCTKQAGYQGPNVEKQNTRLIPYINL